MEKETFAVMPVVRETYGRMYGEDYFVWKAGWKFLAGFTVLSVLLTWAGRFGYDVEGSRPWLLLVLFPLFIGCYRYAVDPGEKGFDELVNVEKKLFVTFLKYSFVQLILGFFFMVVLITVFMDGAMDVAVKYSILGATVLGFVVMMLGFLFVYPAISVGDEASIKKSFADLRGNYLRMVLACVFVCGPPLALGLGVSWAGEWFLSLYRDATGLGVVFASDVLSSFAGGVMQIALAMLVGVAYREVVYDRAPS